VSLPNFARGPGQSIDLDSSGGLPLSISDGSGVTEISFTLVFNSTQITVTAADLAEGIPPDWQVTQFESVGAGRIRIVAGGTTPVDAGPATLLILEATVPADAAQAEAQLLRIDQLQLNGGLLPAIADDAVQVTALIGDVNGSGDYSGLDASLIARVSVGLDSGFDEFGAIDPRIIGDVTGNGRLSALDASFVARKAVGLEQESIPDIPSLLPPPPQFDIDVVPEISSIDVDFAVVDSLFAQIGAEDLMAATASLENDDEQDGFSR